MTRASKVGAWVPLPTYKGCGRVPGMWLLALFKLQGRGCNLTVTVIEGYRGVLENFFLRLLRTTPRHRLDHLSEQYVHVVVFGSWQLVKLPRKPSITQILDSYCKHVDSQVLFTPWSCPCCSAFDNGLGTPYEGSLALGSDDVAVAPCSSHTSPVRIVLIYPCCLLPCCRVLLLKHWRWR